ncbi:MAG TPA: O-antigen ligase family protein, partial [Afifellaceae bacterium]|nr:O-antigen ligase family protein [Afifellaceae bacterium]
QDAALSRRKQGFDSPRARHGSAAGCIPSMVMLAARLRPYLPAETFQPLVWLGLFFGFSALPVALVYSTRSSPLFLTLACLTLLADEYRRNPRMSRLRALSHGSLRKPLVVPLVMMAALGMASALWSAAPAHTFRTALQLAGAVFLGIGWVVLISRFRREHVLPFLAGGLTVALVALPVELFSQLRIRGHFTQSTMLFEHNRTILQLSLLVTLFASLAALSGLGLWRVWAALLLVVSIAMAIVSESQSTLLYWLVIALAALAAGWAPRPSLGLAGLAAGIVVIAFPWAFLFGHEAILVPLTGTLSDDLAQAANVEDRLLIWAEFARLVAERPWLGWGLEAERALQLPVLPSGESRAYSALHPHSLAMELWTGLGAAGAALATVVLIDFRRLVARYADLRLAWATCLFAGIFAVWLVSHGAWEHWWLMMLPLSLGSLLALDFYPGAGPPIAAS